MFLNIRNGRECPHILATNPQGRCEKVSKKVMTLNLIGFANDHDNKGLLNSPSKLPCYRNIFYISPVSSSTFLFSSCSSSLVYIQQKSISFGSQLVRLDYSADGVVDPKEYTSVVEQVENPHNRLWWGWPGHHYLMKIFKSFI
jgi:hypothetical protein